MGNDHVATAIACNRDVSKKGPSPFQDCRDVVHISIFFDGTGNNLEKDAATKSWSNIGRMYNAALQDTKKHFSLSMFPVLEPLTTGMQ
jgi:hypothetical protein